MPRCAPKDTVAPLRAPRAAWVRLVISCSCVAFCPNRLSLRSRLPDRGGGRWVVKRHLLELRSRGLRLPWFRFRVPRAAGLPQEFRLERWECRCLWLGEGGRSDRLEGRGE